MLSLKVPLSSAIRELNKYISFSFIKTLVEEYIYSGDQSDLMDGLENLDLSGKLKQFL